MSGFFMLLFNNVKSVAAPPPLEVVYLGSFSEIPLGDSSFAG